MLMTTATKDKYLCTIPDVSFVPPHLLAQSFSNEAEQSRPSDVVVKEAMQYLQYLKGTCMYTMHGFWTYEYCHLSHLRHFHQDKPTPANPQPNFLEFIMGKFNENTFKYAQLSESLSNWNGGRYISIRIGDGTTCDITGKPRESVVKVRNGTLCTYC